MLDPASSSAAQGARGSAMNLIFDQQLLFLELRQLELLGRSQKRATLELVYASVEAGFRRREVPIRRLSNRQLASPGHRSLSFG
ncbi:MAG: hypothetical protein U0269_03080 [Polyangiales bacterium]